MNDFISYLITDPKYYGDSELELKDKLNKTIQKHKVDIAGFRDKCSDNITNLAKVFLDTCKDNKIETIVINSNIELALELGFNAIHLTSKQFDKIKYCKQKGLYTIISCHDFEEVKKAYDNGADAITYSPIFYTPYKGKPKGIDALNALKDKCSYCKDFKVIALGGIIDQEHIDQIKASKADGFASIRYFID